MVMKMRPIRLRKFLMIFLLIMLSTFQNTVSQEVTNNVKVAFLEKFTRFINWPNESNHSISSNYFIISVVGESPLNNEIYKFYKNRKIKGKDVKINFIKEISEIDKCHLLFITNSEKERLGEIIKYTKDKPILTIGDSDGFAEQGVIINMHSKNNQLRFQINETALKFSGLYMNFKLLSLAEIVNPVGERK